MTKHLKLAVLPVPGLVFFPNTNIPLHLIGPQYIKMAKDCIAKQNPLGIANAIPLEDTFNQQPFYRPRDICGIGAPTIVEEFDDGTLKVLVKGIGKAKLHTIIQDLPHPIFDAEIIYDKQDFKMTRSDDAKVENLKKILDTWPENQLFDPTAQASFSESLATVEQIIDHVSLLLIQDNDVKQIILESDSLYDRISILSLLFPQHSHSKREDPIISHALKNYDRLETMAKMAH